MSTLKEINMRDVRGYSEMIRYLSELSGKPSSINIPIEKWEDTYQVRYCIYEGNVYKLGKRLLKGGIPCYTLNQRGNEVMTLPIEHKFKDMFYIKSLDIDDFGIDYKILPNACKWDEGNGAYSMQDVYVIKDKMFVKV